MRHLPKILILLIPIFTTSCKYSFTGGSLPPHLKDVFVAQVEDNSGYGNPIYRNELNEELVDAIRRDNTLNVVEGNADCRLQVFMTGITDQTISVSTGQIENERRISLSVKAIFTDNVEQKEMWTKTFTKSMNYEIDNSQENRDEAMSRVIDQLSDDIMLAVVSGW